MGAFAPSGDVEGAVGLAAGGAGAGACAGSSEEEVVGAEARWQAAKQSTISPTFRLAQIIHSGRICVIEAGQLYPMEQETIAPSLGGTKRVQLGAFEGGNLSDACDALLFTDTA